MSVNRITLFVALVVLGITVAPGVAGAANLLTNPGFEQLPSGNAPPPGWMPFSGMVGVHLIVEPAGSLGEGHVLAVDTQGTMNSGMRSNPLPAVEGEVYKASARVYAPAGNSPNLYLDYWDANRQRISTQAVKTTKTNQWETLDVTLEAPPGTAWVSIILYSNSGASPGRVFWDDAVLEKDMSYVVKVGPDRADHLYEVGETAEFIVEMLQQGRPAGSGLVSWRFTRDGMDVLSTGAARIENGEVRIPWTQNEPGFVRAHIAVTSSGEPVNATVAVAFSPEKLTMGSEPPADFDAFWAEKKAVLAAVDPEPRMTRVSAAAGLEAFDVQVQSVGAPVSGYMVRPAGAAPGSLPAIITLHGAGVTSANMNTAVSWAREGLLAFDMNAHGIANGQTAAYYERLAQTDLYGHRDRGRESRDEFYFLGMFLRVLRAIDFVTAQPEWDGKTLVLYGTSQGGAQALAGAGLDERVTFFVAGVPSMADLAGSVKNAPMRWDLTYMPKDQADRIRNTLQYFDTGYFAARTRADGFFTAAFLDSVVFPSTVYAAKSAVAGKTDIFNDPLVGHTNTSQAVQAMRGAVLEHVANMKQK